MIYKKMPDSPWEKHHYQPSVVAAQLKLLEWLRIQYPHFTWTVMYVISRDNK